MEIHDTIKLCRDFEENENGIFFRLTSMTFVWKEFLLWLIIRRLFLPAQSMPANFPEGLNKRLKRC